MADFIRLYDICQSGTRALGPGFRYVIWTQGCPFNCPGCISPESRSMEMGFLVGLDSLVDDIVNNHNIEGITISGGEPMIQAKALYELVEKVRQLRPELTVIVFSGFRLEELKSEDQRRLVGSIDLLIDGEYVDALNEGRGLRGSSNQRFHFITDRLLQYREKLEQDIRTIEVHVRRDKTVAYGIPSKGTFN